MTTDAHALSHETKRLYTFIDTNADKGWSLHVTIRKYALGLSNDETRAAYNTLHAASLRHPLSNCQLILLRILKEVL